MGDGFGLHSMRTLDPTTNVIALVRAESRRQDSLRKAESRRADEISALRAAHYAELRSSESLRIDAIRAVDQGNVSRAAQDSADRATALATQLQSTAEAMRVTVEATRITTADALTAALLPIQNDVAVLREVQFRQQGEKTAGVEQHETKNDSRTALFSILGLLVTVAVIVSPHIH